jgi:hypothetical protein
MMTKDKEMMMRKMERKIASNKDKKEERKIDDDINIVYCYFIYENINNK